MLRISDVMTRDVFTLAASTPAETAAWELIVRGFTGAPVRDARGRLVGVLSRSDLCDPERNLSQVAGGAGVDVDLASSGPGVEWTWGGCARGARPVEFRPHMRGDWS